MCITLIDDCPGPSQTCSDCEGLTFVQKQHCNTCRPWSVKYRKDAPFYCEGRRWLQRFHCWKCCAGKDCPDYEEVILTTFCPPCRRNRNQPAESSRTERLERKQAIRAIQNKIKGESKIAMGPSADLPTMLTNLRAFQKSPLLKFRPTFLRTSERDAAVSRGPLPSSFRAHRPPVPRSRIVCLGRDALISMLGTLTLRHHPRDSSSKRPELHKMKRRSPHTSRHTLRVELDQSLPAR